MKRKPGYDMDAQDPHRRSDVVGEPEFINVAAWWAFFWSHRVALLIAFVVSAAAGYGYFRLLPKTFTPRATVLPTQPVSPLSGLTAELGGIEGVSQSLYPQIAGSRAVLIGALDASYRGGTFRRALAAEFDLDVRDTTLLDDRLLRQLRAGLSVSVDPVTNFVKIDLTGRDPRLMADVLNEIVRQMDRFIQSQMRTQSREEREMIAGRLTEEAAALREAEDRLERFREANREISLAPAGLMEQARLAREVDIHSTLYIELARQLDVARIEEYRRMPVLTVLDWAVPPPGRSGPRGRRILPAFVSVGLLGTIIGLKVWDAILHSSIKSMADIARELDIAAIGAIPTMKSSRRRQTDRSGDARVLVELISKGNPKNPIAEAYRALRTGLLYSGGDKPLRSITVSSAGKAEGKSITTANLGITCAQMGQRTLVVDGDLRRPTQHMLFGMEQEHGLTEYLIHDLRPQDIVKPSGVDNLDIITAGITSPNPAPLLGSEKMRNCLQALIERYDIVLVDSPPIIAVTDAVLTGRMTDGVLLVVRSAVTPRTAAKHALTILERAKVSVLGCVLNDVDITPHSGAYYYDYYYGSDGEERDAKPTKPSSSARTRDA